MAEPTEPEVDAPKKKSMLIPLIIGLVLAGGGGAGGFLAVKSGLLGAGSGEEHHSESHGAAEGDSTGSHGFSGGDDIAFVALDPLIISLGPGAANRHLRFSAQLEIDSAAQSRVEKLTPRVLDVLNGYLRAVEMRDLETPSALIRLRAQMLRRIQVVIGEGQVHDLLITEFVLN